MRHLLPATATLGATAFALATTFAAAALFTISADAVAQAKPRIERAADLPRFSYRIDGKVEDVVRQADRFAPFAAALRRDTESVLAGYDIADRATLRGMVGLLGTLDYLDGNYDRALARVDELRALQDKPADRLVAGQRLKAMAVSAKANGPTGEAFRRGVADAIARELQPLPYALIENDAKRGKSSAELAGETMALGNAREVLQPIVDRSGMISSDLAPAVVFARFTLVGVLPLKTTLADAYGAYLAAHRTAKADIWAARDVTLTPAQARAPVVIAVWDSGVETGLFPNQVARDGSGPAVVAYDKYSRPAAGELQPLPAAQAARLPLMMKRAKGFSDLRSNIDSAEAGEVKVYLSGLGADQYRAATEELRLGGNYSHGTHVAGITLAGNPAARLVVGRIEFGHTLQPDPCPSREFAERDAQAAQGYVDYMKRAGVRVVNMSWGGTVGAYEEDLEQCGIGADAEARKQLARAYFEMQKQALTQAFASAPQILFVTAAGNSNNDASFIESVPGSIVLPNLLTVGAVDSAGEEAPFTSYGPTVKVHANGYQVESFLPGGSRVALSGTSMASPQVANLAGKLLAVNPALTPEQLIKVITDTADASADGRRRLVNPKRALAVASPA